MPVADPVISGDQVRHDRIQNLVSTVSVVVGTNEDEDSIFMASVPYIMVNTP